MCQSIRIQPVKLRSSALARGDASAVEDDALPLNAISRKNLVLKLFFTIAVTWPQEPLSDVLGCREAAKTSLESQRCDSCLGMLELVVLEVRFL
eukprot:444136-Pyramimonas_sp.AAC.1